MSLPLMSPARRLVALRSIESHSRRISDVAKHPARTHNAQRPTQRRPRTCPCQSRYFSHHAPLRRTTWAEDFHSASSNSRKLWKQYPYSVTLAVAGILFGAGGWIYVNWFYWKYLHLHNYPEAVAAKLRRAIYFSTTDLKPEKAVEYYKQAIIAAEEERMECWSDEVIGIKLRIVELMEKIRQYEKATQALEVIMRDCLSKARTYDGDATHAKDRTRLMRWTVQMAIKLGELYARPEIWERDTAEERLSWAVETTLKERLRRDVNKLSDDTEGPWLSNEEIAAEFEALGQTYEARDQQYLATPLFLHAINMQPQKNCHTVVMMNNLASSLAQQTPKAATATQHATNVGGITGRTTVPVTRELLVEMAQTWAQKALDVAGSIKPPDRTEECDMGCVVATHNLGELAEMAKNFDEAKKRYREAVSLAKAIGFQEGLEHSSERLRKLEAVPA